MVVICDGGHIVVISYGGHICMRKSLPIPGHSGVNV